MATLVAEANNGFGQAEAARFAARAFAMDGSPVYLYRFSYVQTAMRELSTTKNHTGNIWLNELVVGDSTFDPGVAVATYDPGAKLDWHIHPAGQVLLITEGVGYYQEKGKSTRIVRKGEVIKCPPGIEHWHAAAPNSTFAYIAVTPTSKGKTIWRGPVSDHDYQSVKQGSSASR